MSAQVLTDFFTHEHNLLEVAAQEYRAAKTHFREVLENRIVGDIDHERRFRDAAERRDMALDRYLRLARD